MAIIKKAESLAQLEQILKKEIQSAELAGQEIYQFDPTNGDAYDVMRVKSGRIVSMWGGESLKDCISKRPTLHFCTSSDLMKIRADIHKKPVFEIDEDAYIQALNCLPPVGYVIDSDRNESFKLSERYVDNLTSIYMKVEDRYFSMRDDISKHHNECIALAKSFAQQHQLETSSMPKM